MTATPLTTISANRPVETEGVRAIARQRTAWPRYTPPIAATASATSRGRRPEHGPHLVDVRVADREPEEERDSGTPTTRPRRVARLRSAALIGAAASTHRRVEDLKDSAAMAMSRAGRARPTM